jgi:ribulose-bisphosphate carboxylase large chain
MAQRTAIIGAARACDAPVILHARRGAWSDAGGIVLRQIVEALAETCPKTPICLHQDLGAVPSAAAWRDWTLGDKTQTEITGKDRHRAKAYGVEPAPGLPRAVLARIAYDLTLFEDGSIANFTAWIIGAAFSFKPLKAARPQDMRFPAADVKTFKGRPSASWWSASGPISRGARCQVRLPSASLVCQARNMVGYLWMI